jgi:hypothetical protein
MATLLDLSRAGRIEKYDPALPRGRFEERRIFFVPRAVKWLQNELPDCSSSWNIEASPEEQLYDLLQAFCSGEHLFYQRQLNPIRHISAGIWELKTADVRLFGYFHRKDCFICTDADLASRVKEFKLYNGYRDQAVRERSQLKHDSPTFIPGDDPQNVVSAYSYP